MANLHYMSTSLTSAADKVSEKLAAGPGYDGSDIRNVDPKEPDALNSTKEACLRLRMSAEAMGKAFDAGNREAERLGAALKAAATAYKTVEDQSEGTFGRQMNGDGDTSPPPVEPVPPNMSALLGLPQITLPPFDDRFDDIDEDSNLGWQDMVRAIHIWDPHDPNCGALIKFRDQWNAYQSVLNTHAGKFVAPTDWYGDAADACRQAMSKLSDWWIKMGAECTRLGEQADQVIKAHAKLIEDHPDMDDLNYYLNVQHNLNNNIANWNRSDDAREAYAGDLKIAASRPGQPPTILGLPPVVSNDVGARPGTEVPPPGIGGPPTGGPGTSGGPDVPKMPDVPSVSPAGLDPSAGEKPSESGSPSGGSPSGGGQGGGQPSGGSPSGGAPSGGLPKGTEGMPEMPGLGEPSLKPASAGGGGGMGGGGGGTPSMPLGPAVGADSVAPSPAAARGGGLPGSPGGAGAGGMGGGMGGMGGGHGQNQGKEKRRNPNLAEDEDLYKEDRAYTEAVIGRRARPDAKDTKK